MLSVPEGWMLPSLPVPVPAESWRQVFRVGLAPEFCDEGLATLWHELGRPPAESRLAHTVTTIPEPGGPFGRGGPVHGDARVERGCAAAVGLGLLDQPVGLVGRLFGALVERANARLRAAAPGLTAADFFHWWDRMRSLPDRDRCRAQLRAEVEAILAARAAQRAVHLGELVGRALRRPEVLALPAPRED